MLHITTTDHHREAGSLVTMNGGLRLWSVGRFRQNQPRELAALAYVAEVSSRSERVARNVLMVHLNFVPANKRNARFINVLVFEIPRTSIFPLTATQAPSDRLTAGSLPSTQPPHRCDLPSHTNAK